MSEDILMMNPVLHVSHPSCPSNAGDPPNSHSSSNHNGRSGEGKTVLDSPPSSLRHVSSLTMSSPTPVWESIGLFLRSVLSLHGRDTQEPEGNESLVFPKHSWMSSPIYVFPVDTKWQIIFLILALSDPFLTLNLVFTNICENFTSAKESHPVELKETKRDTNTWKRSQIVVRKWYS